MGLLGESVCYMNRSLRAFLLLVGVMTGLLCCLGGMGPLYSSANAMAQSIKASFVQTMPTAFGKTHFIVGQTPKQRNAQLSQGKRAPTRTATLVSAPAVVLFSPDDDVRAYLIDLIEHEQEHIAIAAFVFTDVKIARALVEACKRGVHVEMVTDGTGLRDRFSKFHLLSDAQVPIFVYDTQHGKAGLGSLMHNKFLIFRKNKNNQSCVCTGSCNFTRSAYESNQENMVIFFDQVSIERFVGQYDTLKGRSYRHRK